MALPTYRSLFWSYGKAVLIFLPFAVGAALLISGGMQRGAAFTIMLIPAILIALLVVK